MSVTTFLIRNSFIRVRWYGFHDVGPKYVDLMTYSRCVESAEKWEKEVTGETSDWLKVDSYARECSTMNLELLKYMFTRQSTDTRLKPRLFFIKSAKMKFYIQKSSEISWNYKNLNIKKYFCSLFRYDYWKLTKIEVKNDAAFGIHRLQIFDINAVWSMVIFIKSAYFSIPSVVFHNNPDFRETRHKFISVKIKVKILFAGS